MLIFLYKHKLYFFRHKTFLEIPNKVAQKLLDSRVILNFVYTDFIVFLPDIEVAAELSGSFIEAI